MQNQKNEKRHSIALKTNRVNVEAQWGESYRCVGRTPNKVLCRIFCECNPRRVLWCCKCGRGCSPAKQVNLGDLPNCIRYNLVHKLCACCTTAPVLAEAAFCERLHLRVRFDAAAVRVVAKHRRRGTQKAAKAPAEGKKFGECEAHRSPTFTYREVKSRKTARNTRRRAKKARPGARFLFCCALILHWRNFIAGECAPHFQARAHDAVCLGRHKLCGIQITISIANPLKFRCLGPKK